MAMDHRSTADLLGEIQASIQYLNKAVDGILQSQAREAPFFYANPKIGLKGQATTDDPYAMGNTQARSYYHTEDIAVAGFSRFTAVVTYKQFSENIQNFAEGYLCASAKVGNVFVPLGGIEPPNLDIAGNAFLQLHRLTNINAAALYDPNVFASRDVKLDPPSGSSQGGQVWGYGFSFECHAPIIRLTMAYVESDPALGPFPDFHLWGTRFNA